MVSSSADRSGAVPLDGTTVSGNMYAFTSPATGVLKSVFYVDDAAAAGPIFHSESTGPYDLNGGSPAAAAPYDTHLLSDGTHTVTQVVTTTANTVETDTATFTVNNSVVLPPAPTGVTATSGNGYVDLGWAASAGSTVGFNVYRGTSAAVSLSGTPLNGASLLATSSYHDATVTNGTTYYYVVQSVDNGGRHSEASAVQGKPVAPPATPPFVLQSSLSPDRSAPTPLDGSTVKGSVYVFTAPETSVKKAEFWLDNTAMSGAAVHSETTGPFDYVGGSPAAATPWDTSVLSNGTHTITQQVTTTTNVVYVFTATFTVNNAVVPPPPPPPAAPTNVQAAPGNGSVDLYVGRRQRRHGGLQRLPRRSHAGEHHRYTAEWNDARQRQQLPRRCCRERAVLVLRRAVGGQHRAAQRGTQRQRQADRAGRGTGLPGDHERLGRPQRRTGPERPRRLRRRLRVHLARHLGEDSAVLAGRPDDVRSGHAQRDDDAVRLHRWLAGRRIAVRHPCSRRRRPHHHAEGDDHGQRRGHDDGDLQGRQLAAAAARTDGHQGNGRKRGRRPRWDAKTGTTAGFNLYRSTSPTVSLSGTPLNGAALLTGTSFHDTNVSNGTTYYYVLSSVDVIGRHSEGDTLAASPNPPGSKGRRDPVRSCCPRLRARRARR